LKRLFLIFLLIFAFGVPLESLSQSGGRQREKGSRRRASLSFKRTRSAGHADQFARGSRNKKSIFAKLFRKKDPPAWQYRASGSPKKNWRDNKFLFSRHRTPGKVGNDVYLDKQRAKRDRHRVRGNDAGGSKKYRKK
jgi:hypothetical protein